MDIRELIAGIEVEQEASVKREQKARKEIEVILATAQQESRSGLTEEEDARCEQLFEACELAKSQQEGIKVKMARARKVEAEDAEAELRLKETIKPPTPARAKPKYDEVMRVGNEERTYHPGSDPKGTKFLRDVARSFLYQDPQSQYRLARHMNEARVDGAMEERAVAGSPVSSDFNGLVVPQYLVEMTAPMVANLRPTADIMNKHQLPANGMTFTIPRVTTATSVANVTDELAAVSATSVGETDLTISVKTAAGQQTLSRAAIDRGSGIEDIVLQDLFARYATNLDNTLLNEASTGLGPLTSSARVVYDDASPTGAALYPKILAAASKSEQALLGYGAPSHVIMHGRRWYWLQSEMTDTWPLVNGGGAPVMAIGTANGAGYNRGVRGQLPCGLNVIVDNNVQTLANGAGESGATQDEIFVLPDREAHLWEEPNAPVYIRAEQTSAARLGVLLVVYGYFAYTFGRYTGAAMRINGTGTVAPTGF